MPKWSIAEMSQKQIDMLPESVRKELGVKSSSKITKDIADKNEREMQNQVHNYLNQLGYRDRSTLRCQKGVTITKPESGWYVHLHATKRNPIILDLIIMSHAGHYLEMELKMPEGTVSPEQQVLINQGKPIAYSSGEACALIKAWHGLFYK